MDYITLYGQLGAMIRALEPELNNDFTIVSFAQDQLMMHLCSASRCVCEIMRELQEERPDEPR
jgi:hypothetical protein